MHARTRAHTPKHTSDSQTAMAPNFFVVKYCSSVTMLNLTRFPKHSFTLLHYMSLFNQHCKASAKSSYWPGDKWARCCHRLPLLNARRRCTFMNVSWRHVYGNTTADVSTVQHWTPRCGQTVEGKSSRHVFLGLLFLFLGVFLRLQSLFSVFYFMLYWHPTYCRESIPSALYWRLLRIYYTNINICRQTKLLSKAGVLTQRIAKERKQVAIYIQ